MLERRADLGSEFALEPLPRESVGDTDEVDIVLFGHDLRVFEPRVVLSARQSDLQLAEGGRPKLFEIQRLPFSTHVLHKSSPQLTPRPPDATPKGKTEDPTGPFRKPANYTPRRSGRACCYARLHTPSVFDRFVSAGEGTRP